MNIEIWCSGASITSCGNNVVDVKKAFGVCEEDWLDLPESEKFNLVHSWVLKRLIVDFNEIED